MLNRTKIEWVRNEDGSPGYTINPVKGLCPVGCSYCYARAMYKRFKWDPEIRYIEPGFIIAELQKMPAGARVFWGSTIELFHDVIPALWRKDIFAIVRQFPELTHIFLTKQPQNLHKWSPFPDNCWVGATAANAGNVGFVIPQLGSIRARVKFISLEPLLYWPEDSHVTPWFNRLDWLIIGQQTPVRKSTMPKIAWVQEVVQAADRAGIPVFLKDNLKGLLPEAHPFYTFPWESDPEAGASVLRQELPEVKAHAQ